MAELHKNLLRSEMALLSQHYFQKPWQQDLEYILWSAATLDQRCRFLLLDQDQVDKLRTLAAQADGWWTQEGFTFMPLLNWIHAYHAWVQARIRGEQDAA